MGCPGEELRFKMMKNKKTHFLALLLAALLLLCACDGAGSGTETGSATDETETGAEQTEPVNENELRLMTDGKFRYRVIRADTPTQPEMEQSTKVYKNLLSMTGAEDIDFATDWIQRDKEYDPETYEILVGDTAYPQTAEFKKGLKWNEYGFGVVGHKLVIASWSYAGLRSAVMDFLVTVRDTSVQSTDRKTMTLELAAPVIHSLKNSPAGVPDYDGGELFAAFTCDDGEFEFIIDGTNEAEFNAYLSKLGAAGYTEVSRNKLSENTYVYFRESHGGMVYTYYTPKTERVSVVCGTDTVKEINITDEAVCPMLLTQFGIIGEPGGMGMSYLIRLADSSFIIIDGGYNKDGKDVPMLLGELEKQNERSDKRLIVRAWILTHAHADHYATMRAIATTYSGRLTVERLMYTRLGSDYQAVGDSPNVWDAVAGMQAFAGLKHVKPQAGQVFKFPGCSMEILFTARDCFTNPYYVQYLNDASMVFRINADCGTKILFTGDIMEDSGEIVAKLYGDYLRSDILQICHHGYYGGSKAFYSAVSPTVAMWPILGGYAASFSRQAVNAHWQALPSLKQIVDAGSGTWTVQLPYQPE